MQRINYIPIWKRFRQNQAEENTETQLRSSSVFVKIPIEVIQLILQFYTNSWHGLYGLRMINSELKLIAETSLLWNSIELLIICPKGYLLHFNRVNPANMLYVGTIRNTPLHELRYAICDQNLFSPTAVNSLPEKGLIRVRVVKDASSQQQDVFEQAFKVSTAFHDLQLQYQKLWQSEIRKMKRMHDHYGLIFKYFQHQILPYSFILINFLFLLSFYGFYTLQQNINQYQTLHWENQLSFLCIECICLIYAFTTFLDQFLLQRTAFYHSDSFQCNYYYWNNLGGHSFVILLFIFLLSMLILIQINLTSSPTDLQYPWSILLIPCGMALLIQVMSLIWHGKISPSPRAIQRGAFNDDDFVSGFFGSVLLVILIVCIILVVIFVDGIVNVKYPFGYGIIPLFTIIPIIIYVFFRHAYIMFSFANTNSLTVVGSIRVNNSTLLRKALNLTSAIASVFIIVLILLLCFIAFESNWAEICHLPVAFLVDFLLFSLQLWASCVTSCEYVLDNRT